MCQRHILKNYWGKTSESNFVLILKITRDSENVVLVHFFPIENLLCTASIFGVTATKKTEYRFKI